MQDRLDQCSAAFIAASRLTPAQPLAAHGLRHAATVQLGPHSLLLNSDGIGTKIEVAERLARYSTLGQDLLAMLLDDAIRWGARPLALANVLDCSRAHPGLAAELAAGLAAAAQHAGVALLGGEVAELGSRVAGHGPHPFNWSGTLLSVLDPTLRPAAPLTPGLSIVALREAGLRSNGYTLARQILTHAHGQLWHQACLESGQNWGEALLTPSTLYTPALLPLLPQVPVAAIVHVTGGGIPGKLARQLAGSGLGARLDALFPPAPALLELQRLGSIPDPQAYQTWNMGQGLLLITPEPARLIGLLAGSGLEARRVGCLEPGSRLRLLSLGARTPGAWLDFGVELDMQGSVNLY